MRVKNVQEYYCEFSRATAKCFTLKKARRSVATAATGYEHVVLNEEDVAIIKGTKMKVIAVIQEKIVYD
jgi:hypothetical protein